MTNALSSTAPRRSLRALAPLAVVALALRDPAAAVPVSGETYFESVDVSVVNVDVVVTDAAGRRITDLRREDFRLFEDDQPVEISNFYVATAERQGSAADAPARLEVEVPAEERIYLAILIDNASLTPELRSRLLPALHRLLAEPRRPGVRLLLASYEGDEVRLRQPPTTDAQSISAALDQVARTALMTQQDAERRRLLRDIATAAAASEAGAAGLTRGQDETQFFTRDAEHGIQAEAAREAQAAERTARAVGQFVGALGGLPGRKVLVYAGGGLSIRPGQALVAAFRAALRQRPGDPTGGGSTSLEPYERDTTPLIRELAARANTSRVTFYPLGATATLGVSGETSGTEVLPPDLQAIEESNHAASLALLAGDTGGLFALNPANPASLFDEMRADFESFYSLGYAPPRAASGKSHRLRVELARPGLKARLRDSYRGRTAEDRAAARTQAALLLGESDNPLQVALEVESEARDKDGNWQVALLVKFPVSKVTLLPHENVHEGAVSLFVASRDLEGRMSAVSQLTAPVRVANDDLLTASRQQAAVRVRLLLRPGAQTLAVTVRDQLAHLDSTVVASYPAAAHAQGGRAQ